MKLLIRLILSTIAVLVADLLLRGVQLGEFPAALWVAIVLGALNTFLRPVLILLTLPVTLITLGIFILVINAGLVLLAAYLMPGNFHVDGFWWALAFSLVMWAVQGFLLRVDGEENN
ncbi:MAG TPA: phage holin family protein [Flavobacteriales bacterium]|nr:phage holin family protein [Flavobacteriales bacterium]HNK86144.1 phage holin family protein [Flavobacteriales bacterium]HNM70978.1 phage holin family protein [Flavobacteriales bacterium]HNO06508.1 phage holin family protein [Flavobacteriales bacterium]